MNNLPSTEEHKPPLLINIATEVRAVNDKAVRDLGYDLGGFSVLDLLADNFPTYDLQTLKDAAVVAGCYAHSR